MKVMKREYYCPVCGHVQMIETNHENMTLSGCKLCGNQEMYFNGGNTRKTISQYIINPYYYNIKNEDEKKEYNEIVKKLKKYGYEKWESRYDMRNKSLNVLIEHGVETLDIFHTFDTGVQHLGNRGRVFNWFECVCPNKNIKKGYYLEKVKGCDE